MVADYLERSMEDNNSIFISGMHRSGTSATARICNLLGLDLGSKLMSPGLDNIRGYWEHDVVVARHEELLTAIGMSWDSVAAMPVKWSETLAARNCAAKLEILLDEEFSGKAFWGLKDPRLCRLLPMWTNLLAQRGTLPCLLMALRNPMEVADSLARRDGFSKKKSALLWLRYILEAEKNSRGLRRFFLTFDQLFGDWQQTFEDAAEALCISWPTTTATAAHAVNEFIERSHRHHWASRDESVNDDHMSLAIDLYRSLADCPLANSHKLWTMFDEATKAVALAEEEEIASLLEHQRTALRALPPMWESVRKTNRQIQSSMTSLESDFVRVREQTFKIANSVAESHNKMSYVLDLQVAQSALFEKQNVEIRSEIHKNRTHFDTVSDQLEKSIHDNRENIRTAELSLNKNLENAITKLANVSISLSEMDERLTQFINEEKERRSVKFLLRRIKRAIQAVISFSPLRSEQLREDTSPLREGIKYSLDSIKLKNGTLFGFGWIFHTDRKIVGADIVVQRRSKVERLKCIYGSARDDVARDWPCEGAISSGFWFTGKPMIRFGSRFWLEAHFDGPAQSSVLLPLPNIGREGTLYSCVHEGMQKLRKAWALVRQGEYSVLVQHVSRFLGRKFRSLNKNNSNTDLTKFEQSLVGLGQTHRKLTLVIDHNLGGGANVYRNELIAGRIQNGCATLLLSFDLPNQCYTARLRMPGGGCDEAAIESLEDLNRLFERTAPDEIVLNNLYTLSEVIDVVGWLELMTKKFQAKLVVPIHDFMPICPSFTLINSHGKFCGVPNLSECEKCLPIHQAQFTNFVHCRDIHVWRKRWAGLLEEADEIICFSNASANLMLRAYPHLSRGRIFIRPHELATNLRIPTLTPGRITVGVVGTIDANKGIRILRDMAKLIRQERLPIDLVVIGTVLEPIPDEYGVCVHGGYQRHELPDLLEKYGVNISFFPSIWPETFSYVCEELMRMQVPLVAFNLGAPAERIKDYKNGLLITDISAAAALDGVQELYTRHYQKTRLELATGRVNASYTASDRRTKGHHA